MGKTRGEESKQNDRKIADTRTGNKDKTPIRRIQVGRKECLWCVICVISKEHPVSGGGGVLRSRFNDRGG